MAMISCPECQKEVSNRAYACPHCGYPLKQQEKPSYYYTLRLGAPSMGGLFETVLKVCAFICWVGGVILAFSGGKAINRWGEAEFSFIPFITILIPYIIYGLLFYGMATVVEQVGAIYGIVQGLNLIRNEEKESKSSSSNARSESFVLGDKWKCTKCGTYNPRNAQSCKGCGMYR